MWYITSYIWYIGPVHRLEKQWEMILSYKTIGRMIGKLFNYSLGQTHRTNHSSGNWLESGLFLGLVLQQEQLAWKGLSVWIARMEGQQEERWPCTMDIKLFSNTVLHDQLLLICSEKTEIKQYNILSILTAKYHIVLKLIAQSQPIKPIGQYPTMVTNLVTKFANLQSMQIVASGKWNWRQHF